MKPSIYLLAFLLGMPGTLYGWQQPTVTTELAQSAAKKEQLTLTLTLQIPDGFHLYGAKNASSQVGVKFANTGGLKLAGDLKVPDGKIRSSKGQVEYWLEGTVELVQQFSTSESGLQPTTVHGTVEYMMCDRKHCLPPASLSFSATLKRKESESRQQDAATNIEKNIRMANARFEQPVIIKSANENFNEDGKCRFPSPGLFDVDNDGDIELIIGNLDGDLIVLENESNTKQEEPVWGKPVKLENNQEKAISLPNW